MLHLLSPALGLALAAGFVAGLVYAALAGRPLRLLPVYWCLGIAGFAAGQLAAAHGARWLPVGQLALGSGVVACIVLFVIWHLLSLWYTWAYRARLRRVQSDLPRRVRARRP